jgi:hypothetical protein
VIFPLFYFETERRYTEGNILASCSGGPGFDLGPDIHYSD